MAGFEHRSSHRGLALRTRVGIGERDAAVYWVWLRIPNGARGAAMWRIPVLEEELGPDVDFLIGMDIITKGDLHVTRGRTAGGPTSSLVFRVAE